MKKLLLILLLVPLFSTAQNTLPRFENDTLYTSGGYKIYKGQILQFATGTSAAGYFRFIKFHQNMAKNDTYILQNGTMLVKTLKGYKYSGPENNNIRLTGTATYINGKQEEIDILVNFERVISGSDGLPGELTVDKAFKMRPAETEIKETKKQTVTDEIKKQPGADDIKKIMVADEIKKLFDLYKAGALTKEEYEAQKKKLLERQ